MDNELSIRLGAAEAIILQVMHMNGPVGEAAWRYYQKYITDQALTVET